MPQPEMNPLPVPCSNCRRELAPAALFCPTCGTPRVRDGAVDELIGAVLADRFLVIDRLGAGKSGTIYRGEHVTLRRKVAIKVLHHELSRDDLAIERFRREATSVAEIDNEHIVEIHDFGRTSDGRLYLAMELLEGETLDNVLVRDGKLAVDRALDVMIQVADALADAHAVGFVHRDLRPRNLYLAVRRGKANFVKLLDFGLAKLVENGGGAASTSLGMTFGDPRYMSPEQAKGDPTDRRSDLYSLGCIAMEMLTGEPPFVGGRVFDVLTRHVSEPAPRLLARRPDAPPWLDVVLARLLAKAPDDRFVTAAKLAEVLRGAGAVAVEEPPSASGRRGPTGTPAVGVPAVVAGEVAVAPAVVPVAAVAPPVDPGAGDRVAIPIGVADAASGPVGEPTDRVRHGSEADDADRSREDLAPRARRASGPSPDDDPRLSGAWFADGEGADPSDSGVASLAAARRFIDPGDSLDEYRPPRTNYKPFVIAGVAALVLVLVLLLVGGGDDEAGPAAPAPAPVAALAVDAGAPPAIDAGVEVDAAAAGTGQPSAPSKPVDPPKPPKPSNGSGTPTRTLDPESTPPDEPDPAPSGTGGQSDEQAQLAEFYAKAGDAALRGGDPVGAASNYQKALSANPKNLDAIIGLGEVALSQGQYGPGITQLKKAARLAPRRARIHTLLGEAYLNTGNAVAAEQSFRKALQLDPDDARARNGYNEAAGRLPPPSDDP
ncbi:MAG: protein kinase [Kofleriaceae bacterium]|nr:protein kinase [Kofleriaceae bacterium]MBP9167588.1 protein kinase [Kofleriaceae bacterium]MBP9856670.1 protein kinase [Kofleriaceae bacterium]